MHVFRIFIFNFRDLDIYQNQTQQNHEIDKKNTFAKHKRISKIQFFYSHLLRFLRWLSEFRDVDWYADSESAADEDDDGAFSVLSAVSFALISSIFFFHSGRGSEIV